MIRLLIVATLSLGLTGCLWQTVNSAELEKAVESCGEISKIYSIRSNSIGGVAIYCKNGDSYFYNNGKRTQ